MIKRYTIKDDKKTGTTTDILVSWHWYNCAIPLQINFSRSYPQIQFLWLSIAIDKYMAPNSFYDSQLK